MSKIHELSRLLTGEPYRGGNPFIRGQLTPTGTFVNGDRWQIELCDDPTAFYPTVLRIIEFANAEGNPVVGKQPGLHFGIIKHGYGRRPEDKLSMAETGGPETALNLLSATLANCLTGVGIVDAQPRVTIDPREKKVSFQGSKSKISLKLNPRGKFVHGKVRIE